MGTKHRETEQILSKLELASSPAITIFPKEQQNRYETFFYHLCGINRMKYVLK